MVATAADADARRVALALVSDLGPGALDADPLANAALPEALALLWIDRAPVRGRAWVLARVAAPSPSIPPGESP